MSMRPFLSAAVRSLPCTRRSPKNWTILKTLRSFRHRPEIVYRGFIPLRIQGCMNRWFFLVTFVALLVGLQSWRSARAESPRPRICAEGSRQFGKLSCVQSSDREPLWEAYFLGTSSLDDVEKKYPERFEKLKRICQKKGLARQLASASGGSAFQIDPVEFKIESIDSCNGKHGFQEPCARNEDCIEKVCHPVRGTCSAVFTVPASFGN